MKIKTTILQISTIFPSLLALLVGFTLVLRSREDDDLGKRLGAAEVVFARTLELGNATHDYLRQQDDRSRERWTEAYEALGRDAMHEFDPEVFKLSGAAGSIRPNYKRMGQVFDDLVRITEEQKKTGDQKNPRRETEKELLLKELMIRSQSMASEAVMLVKSSHMGATARQQVNNAVIIILSSLVAVLMGLGAYLVVRTEMADRKKVDEDLKQSDIRLSDAFLKLRRATDQIVHVERLQAVETVARGMIHESRNAISAIISAAGYLINTPEANKTAEDVSECLQAIDRSARRINDSMDNLSAMIRAKMREQKTPVDVNSVVKAIVSSPDVILKNLPGWPATNVDLHLGPVSPVECKQSDLADMLKHVIRNAVEAMPKGGSLVIKTQSMEKWIGIEIADAGCGMTEEVKRRACEPFFSTKGPNSAGMGLAIVKGIVAEYQGTIDIESKVGKGTTVVVCMPSEAEMKEVPSPVGGADEPVPRMSVLVVDDEAWARMALVNEITGLGHSTEVASDAAEAVHKMKTGRFDLVLTDRAMPGPSGQMLAADIKKAYPGKPVVLVSGYAEAVAEASDPNVDAVIAKPVKTEELRRAFATAIRVAKAKNRN